MNVILSCGAAYDKVFVD